VQRLFIIACETLSRRLVSELRQAGYACYAAGPGEDVNRISADLALVEAAELTDKSGVEELCRRITLERHIPVILLSGRTITRYLTPEFPCNDFILEPYDRQELVLRIKRLLSSGENTAEQIKCGDLTIDPERAEVYLSGKPVELTFREYELLRYLLGHQGRVFSREALLNAVWGYDYFGGDRTVDVHIRRLRSKIEDSEHSFIDTVRNMGYRFKKQE
jgi:DNA-binding response OmpR family regulator